MLPISEPGKRWQFNGFSIIPPTSNGWEWVGSEGQPIETFFNATYLKKMSPASVIAEVSASKLGEKRFTTADELSVYIESLELMQEGPRQKNVKSSVWPDREREDICVRWYIEAKDDNVPGYVGRLFSLDLRGIACIHPHNEDVIVMANISRRTPEGQQPISSDKEGVQYIDSMRMNEITW